MSRENLAQHLVTIEVRDDDGRVIGSTQAVSFKGLLAMAHEDEISEVTTELVQLPTNDNGQTAVVKAKVVTKRGTFSGTGDANPENVTPRIVPHTIRMAETRAIARALRLAVNIGEVASVELMDEAPASLRSLPPPPVVPRPASGRRAAVSTQVENDPEREEQEAQSPPKRQNAKPERFRGRDDRPTEAKQGDERAMSSEQRRLLFRLAYELGETRDGAAERVLEALGVERFEWATRAMASRAIDALKIAQAKSERQGNGASPHG